MVNLTIVEKLLKGFQISLENRKIEVFFGQDNFLKELLIWHFLIWENKKEYSQEKKNTEVFVEYSYILGILDSILMNIIQRILKEKSKHLSFPFFDGLKKHYISHKDNPKYLENFFNIFCPKFFDNIHKSSEFYDIWNHYFPDDWKITKKTLENKESCVAKVWLFEFLEWASPRIETPEEKGDLELESITRELFPEIDPILWARFLIFTFTPFYENKIKSVVERDWNFGFVGHMHSGNHTDSFEKDFKETERLLKENTIDFIHYFNNTIMKSFSEDDLFKYKGDILALKDIYKKDSKEERHRLGLLYLITQLIEYKK